MWDKIVLNMVIGFVLRQLAKFGKTIDWAKVKADADVRVRQLVPGTWFDDEAVALVNGAIDAVVVALGAEGAWDKLLHALANQDWDGALTALRELLAKVWHPTAKTNARLVAALEFHTSDAAA